MLRFWSEYANPHLGRWFRTMLRRLAPDVVHFQGAYRLTLSAIDAADALGHSASPDAPRFLVPLPARHDADAGGARVRGRPRG